jgi:hypothetical protein
MLGGHWLSNNIRPPLDYLDGNSIAIDNGVLRSAADAVHFDLGSVRCEKG